MLHALENALAREPDVKISKRILRLIGKPGSGPEKEQRYVDTAEIKVEPSDLDSKLFDTRIAGTFFRDLLVMEGRIEFLDTLYLMREPDNKYDTNAILVTSDDGYVLGYVPKAVNTLPASMMDAGEKLYAVLICDSVDEKSPCIRIMRNNPPVKNGKVITLPFGNRESWMDS